MRCALLIVLMLLCGCDSANSRRVPVSKVISEKLAATEQRMSFDPCGWVGRTTVVRLTLVFTGAAKDQR